MLNHFQSQRPFRPFRLLAGKHEFKGRWGGELFLKLLAGGRQIAPSYFAFPFMFRVQAKE